MPDFSADRNAVVPSPIDRDLVAAVNRRLLSRHGTTMGYVSIAEELGSTPNAVRLRQFRTGDLPRPIQHLKENRWPTPTIAEWLCHLSNPDIEPAIPLTQGHQERASDRPRGRPRLQRQMQVPHGSGLKVGEPRK